MVETIFIREASQLLAFRIEEQCYALHLECVERVILAVEIAPLPQAPPVVLGVINLGGGIVPVINARRRFNRPERELKLADHFVICRTSRRRVALVVDAATQVIQVPREAIVAAERIVPGMEYVEGITKLPEGLILIHDLEKFLSLEEEQTIQQALAQL